MLLRNIFCNEAKKCSCPGFKLMRIIYLENSCLFTYPLVSEQVVFLTTWQMQVQYSLAFHSVSGHYLEMPGSLAAKFSNMFNASHSVVVLCRWVYHCFFFLSTAAYDWKRHYESSEINNAWSSLKLTKAAEPVDDSLRVHHCKGPLTH